MWTQLTQEKQKKNAVTHKMTKDTGVLDQAVLYEVYMRFCLT